MPIAAVVLGAIVAPPDPLAALAARLGAVLDGAGLFNDVTATTGRPPIPSHS
ncbi:hypothetical protein [Nocardia sp. NPDC050793]|uniref:hypothetical protein n=1 Tax=Nocardia sp. NPDC050793 TaxID=3155159 RepID=UPI0033F70858